MIALSGKPLPHPAIEVRYQTDSKRLPFYLLLCSLLFEFGRPQDILPGLGAIPFASVLDALLALSVVLSGKSSFSNMQTKGWIALLTLMVLHVPLATNNFWAFMIAKDMTFYFFVYLGTITFVNTFTRMQTMVKVWLGIHLILALNGMAHKGQGIGGWMGDENDFCMVINMIIPFAYFMVLASTNKFYKGVYLTLLGTFVLTAMMTLSRGGFIGLTAVGMYCWFYSSKKFRAMALVGVMIIFAILVAPEDYWSEIQSINDEQTMGTGTGGERLYTWGIGWEIFLNNPIVGVGQGNFQWTFGDYEGLGTFNERSLAGRAAHSAYFTLLPELGLIGTSIFLGMLFYSYKDVRTVELLYGRSNNIGGNRLSKESEELERAFYLGRAMLGAIIGYLISSIFISTLYYPSVWVAIAFIVALRNATLVYGPRDAKSSGFSAQTMPPRFVYTPRLRPRPGR